MIFYDDGMGWRKVETGKRHTDVMVVKATLASSEDPLEAEWLSPSDARCFAIALLAAAEVVESENAKRAEEDYE